MPLRAGTLDDAAPGLDGTLLGEVSPKPFFEENELLNDSAIKRLQRETDPAKRALIYLTQGLTQQALDELKAVSTSTADDALVALALVHQHRGQYAEARTIAARFSEPVAKKNADWLVILEAGARAVDETVQPLVAQLQKQPKDAGLWSALSQAWLSPSLQVRRNALAAATVARALAPESPEAQAAEAEALAAYAYTDWTQRATCPMPEQVFRRRGDAQPPLPLRARFEARLSEEPANRFVGKMRALHLLARQPGASQTSGARLEGEALDLDASDDPRLRGVRLALRLLSSEKAGESWDLYRDLGSRKAGREYLDPIRVGCRDAQLILYDLLKPTFQSQAEAIETLASAPIPVEGQPVFWAGWRQIAEGLAVSKSTLGRIPPDKLRAALLRLDAINRSQDPDPEALGALGRAWFAGNEVYSADEYTEVRREFLIQALNRLQDAVANGGPATDRMALALAYRAAGDDANARDQVARLVLFHNPVLKAPADAAGDWLRLGLTCLEVEASPASEERAERCFKEAEKLIGRDPQLSDLVVACRVIAGTAKFQEIDGVLQRGACFDKLPPLGAEIATRLHQRETARAYFELVCGFTPSRHLLNYESPVADRGRFARITLPKLAREIEERLVADKGFPRNSLQQDALRAVVDRAFRAPAQLQQQVLDTRAALRRKKMRDWNDRALDGVLANALPTTDFLVDTLHRAMAAGAVKKSFEETYDNFAFTHGLVAVLRLVAPDGTERSLKPPAATQESWEDFLVSLTVGYLDWAASKSNPHFFGLGVDDLSTTAVEALKLRPARSAELKAAAVRYDTQGKKVREAVVAEFARKREQERAQEEEYARQAAERRAREAEEAKNPYIIAGLDFTPPKPPPPPAPVYDNWQSNEPEQITCSTCGGTGTTRTSTSWSNSALETCWRCKGKGYRSPHAM
ncbi:hypothetical protein [Nibricoccus sp. IMCC34717]|uniref:hypothetical protein n=1 Tax=Nibricoccus sp. IMCC34717 TaxID=3034021 RepID=UPI00384D2937